MHFFLLHSKLLNGVKHVFIKRKDISSSGPCCKVYVLMFVHNCLSHMVTMISDTEIFPCHDIKIFSIFSPDMHLSIAPSCFSVFYCTIYSFLWSVQRIWIVNFIVLFGHLQMPDRIYAKKAISSLEDVDISIQFVIEWSGW